jgi:hypothetical protein
MSFWSGRGRLCSGFGRLVEKFSGFAFSMKVDGNGYEQKHEEKDRLKRT